MILAMDLSREISETTGGVGLASVQWRDSIKEKQIDYPWILKYRLSGEKDKAAHKLGRNSLDPSRVVRMNNRKTQLGSKSFNSDGIVKHMLNVPGFLQKVEKENSIQEKALNFGVLDWKLLARWKHTERMTGEYHKKSSSIICNSTDNGPPKMSLNSRRPVPLRGLSSTSLSSEKQPISHDSWLISQSRIPAPVHYSKLSASEKVRCITCQKDKNYLENVKSKVDEVKNNREPTRKEVSLGEEFQLSGGIHKDFLSPEDRIHAQGKNNKTKLDDAVDLPSDRLPYSESSHFAESKVSLVEQLPEEMVNQISDDVSLHELCEVEFLADFWHSSHLLSGAAVHTESVHGVDNLETFSAYENMRRASFSVNIMDNALDEIANHQNVKVRPSSPSRRFVFNLGKISRSFSFRDPSVRTETSAVMNNNEQRKVNASIKIQSSSFRRLLDPLLKQKGGKTTVKQQNGGLDIACFTDPSTMGPSHDKENESSTFHAILQITLKNGLPFFKLLVDNSGIMLAAAVKSLPKSAGSDGCTSYAFYSVHEIKKKSKNWISQRLKSEDCSLGCCNIIGHMKISTSYHPKKNPAANSAYVASECVLYGIEQGQLNNQKSEFPSDQEIAAIVVENSNDKNQFLNRMDSGTLVILPGGIHSTPTEGKPSSLISRWRSGGWCDCGGWDIGCKLRILASNSNIRDILGASNPSFAFDRFDLYEQAAKTKPVFSMELCGEGLYSVRLDSSIALLESFATCVGYVTCKKFNYLLSARYVGIDKTTSAPTKYVACPPSSPVGRI